jgi:hypothetical protein
MHRDKCREPASRPMGHLQSPRTGTTRISERQEDWSRSGLSRGKHGGEGGDQDQLSKDDSKPETTIINSKSGGLGCCRPSSSGSISCISQALVRLESTARGTGPSKAIIPGRQVFQKDHWVSLRHVPVNLDLGPMDLVRARLAG